MMTEHLFFLKKKKKTADFLTYIRWNKIGLLSGIALFINKPCVAVMTHIYGKIKV